MIEFSKEFLFGATLSAYPIEGDSFNCDWWRWEQRPGRIRDGASAHPGARHFEFALQDIELAHRLGLRALVFEIEWSRVEPEEGQSNNLAMGHYVRIAEAMVQRGIEPIVVMHHATSPIWFADSGGWHGKNAVGHFWRYAETVINALAPICRHWIPILEPLHVATQGYIQGCWPPGLHAPKLAYAAVANQFRAHRAVYESLKLARADARVGFSVRARRCAPSNNDSAWDLRMARREQERSVRLPLDGMVHGNWRSPFKSVDIDGGSVDFIVVSYDGPESVRFVWNKPKLEFAEVAGDAPPEALHVGLEHTLLDLSHYGLPLLIAGAGIATADDAERSRYLLEVCASIRRVQTRGVKVFGFCYRSLLDSFEWDAGYSKRYGLVHVDRPTAARTPNASAYLLKDIAEHSAIRPGAVARFSPGWTEQETKA